MASIGHFCFCYTFLGLHFSCISYFVQLLVSKTVKYIIFFHYFSLLYCALMKPISLLSPKFPIKLYPT